MSERLLKRILLAAGIIFMLVFCLTPFIYMIVVSVSEDPSFLSESVEFSSTLANYRDVLTVKSLRFLTYLKNSVVIGGLVALITGGIAALSAYAVSRIEFRGRIWVPLAVLAFSMFPQISVVGYLYKLMRAADLINTYPALILPYIAWTAPLAFWILLSYMMQIPRDFDDAAFVDGAGRFTIFRKIIVPVALPGIVSAMLLVFIAAFNEFLFALMLTSDHRARTIPVGIALFEGLHGEVPWGYIMAASGIATFPLVVMSLYFQKFVIQDVTRGALKG